MTQPNGSSLLTLSKTLAGGPYPRIKDAAAAHGVGFGMAVRASYLTDPVTGPMVSNECSVIIPEFEMQSSVTQPVDTILDPEGWDFTEMDAISSFADAHGQALHGHAILFHNTDVMADWQEDILAVPNQANAEALITNRLEGLQRYSFPQLQIVNEPLAAGASGYRTDSPWYIGYGGVGYIQFAFEEGRRLHPASQLGFNDYGFENQASAGNDGKRAEAITLATSLAGLGLIDFVGCQTHVFSGASYQTSLEQVFRPWLASIRALGLKVHLTELDYLSTATRGTDEELDAYAQDRLKRVVGTWAEDMREGEQLVVWGIKDDLSWLQDPANNGGITQQRPLPWDSNGNPKTMERMLRRIFA